MIGKIKEALGGYLRCIGEMLQIAEGVGGMGTCESLFFLNSELNHFSN